MKKKIYIGIVLIIGGFIASFVLFSIYPLLMSVGNVILMAGIICLGSEIISRRNGREYTYQSKTKVKQDSNIQHMICCVCGLPNEKLRRIDGELLCHSCFMMQHGDTDSCDEEETVLSVDDAVTSLRKKIIAEITGDPDVKYRLFSLLWQDAERCFPNKYYDWTWVGFFLDLKTGMLLAELSTQIGQHSTYEEWVSLSATEFVRIAKQYNMSCELQAFKKEEDWAKLFDDNLNEVVSSVWTAWQMKHGDFERKIHSVRRIPYSKKTPDMYLLEVAIENSQAYSKRSVKVTNEEGKYVVVYTRELNISPGLESYSRVLSSTEAVWLEEQIKLCIDNSDKYEESIFVYGDTMNIVIRRNNGENVSFRDVKPTRNHFFLWKELENLAQYGSVSW